jgi:hypothetical protein
MLVVVVDFVDIVAVDIVVVGVVEQLVVFDYHLAVEI